MLRLAILCATAATFVLGTAVELPNELHETSGLISSHCHKGCLWTINDSGNEPEIWEFNPSDGKLGHTIRIADATNRDWEAIAASTWNHARYIYVGDVGGNGPVGASEFTIHRLREPTPAMFGSQSRLELKAVRLTYSYADGKNHDCEAMAVVPDGTIYLLLKHRKDEVVRLFKIQSPRWNEKNIAVPVSKVDLMEGKANALVSDMAFSEDGNELSVVSYLICYSFPLKKRFDIENIDWNSEQRREVWIAGLCQPEGVCYAADGSLYVSAESVAGRPARIAHVDVKPAH